VKLYHGTTAKVAELALVEGLQPRGERTGNWEHSIESNPNAVYLTSAYAPYFAVASGEVGEDLAIIEVDTDLLCQYLLIPDEDFLEQGTRGQPLDDHPELNALGDDMLKRTEWFREHAYEHFQHAWELSVEHLGNCAYSAVIPPEAMTRASAFGWDDNAWMIGHALDPCISLLNYQICGSKYRHLTQWFMGEPIDARKLTHMGSDVEWEMIPEHAREEFAKQVADQSGLRLIKP
jgi:hypothetical protein